MAVVWPLLMWGFKTLWMMNENQVSIVEQLSSLSKSVEKIEHTQNEVSKERVEWMRERLRRSEDRD